MSRAAAEDGSRAPVVLSQPYYQRLFEVEESHGWRRGMASYNVRLVGPLLSHRPGLRVLDSGCGTGSLMSWLRARGAHVVGMDLVWDGLAFSRRRGQARLVQGSCTSLPFADQSFDLIVCTDVLQHLFSPPGDAVALAESLRVLRPGGYLFVRTNSGCGEADSVDRSPTYRRYTRAELTKRVTRAGFLVQRCTYANALPALPTLLRRRVQTRRLSGKAHERHADPGLSLRLRPPRLRWIDDVLATTLQAEARVVVSAGVGLNLPFGDSLLLLATKPAVAGERAA